MTMCSPVALGIDLGTTNSCVAVFTDNVNEILEENPSIIPNKAGQRTTPSFVCIDENSTLIGIDAKKQWPIQPRNVFYSIKRIIGRKFNERIITNDIKNYTFKVLRGKNDLPYLEVEDGKGELEKLEPEQISAFVLQYLKESVDEKFEKTINNVVITVPANFNDYQRRATKDAALIAGLDPIDVISEPVAAAITYAYFTGVKSEERNIIVYDFGGGTLDVSLVKIKGGVFTVLATAGDSHFGGTDIDRYLCEIQIDKIKEGYGIDINVPTSISGDKCLLIRSLLMKVCEEAKIALSSMYKIYEYDISNLLQLENGNNIDFRVRIAEAEIDSYLTEHENDILNPVRLVLEQSKIPKDKIDDLVLVGGSSRIPKLIDMIGKEVGKAAYMPLNPDSAIAQGGAIYCAYKKMSSQSKNLPGFNNFEIQEVTPMAIGIGTRWGTVEHILQRNETIPKISEWKPFVYNKYSFDLSKLSIALDVYEGDSDKDSECHLVGEFRVEIPKNDNRESIPIYTRIAVDNKGITLEAILSDEEPKELDNIKRLHIKNNKPVHTPEEIVILRNQCIKIINPKPPPVIPYYILLYEILNKIGQESRKIIDKKTPDKKQSKALYDCVKEFIKNIKERNKKYSDNSMTKEIFDALLNDFERGIDEIIPDMSGELTEMIKILKKD